MVYDCGKYKITLKKIIRRLEDIPDDSRNMWLSEILSHFGTGCVSETSVRRVKHTKQELIEAGFDWVFFCDGVTVEEVYEDL